jgi:gliding-associated putative ABC transporter substrate-binding component GldG
MSLESKSLHRVLILLTGFFAVLLINQLANRYRIIWDFTEEKRYTLHPSTIDVLGRMSEPVQIEVFLAGEMPSNFKRFQNSIRETLEQFTIHAGRNIQYKFTDPAQAASARSRNEFFRMLIDKGLQPSNITYTKGGDKMEKLVFPGALVTCQGKEFAVNLLKGNRAKSPEEMLNQSIEGLEYELINGIYQSMQSNRKRVGLITGHDEPDSIQLAGLTNTVLSKYDLYTIDLPVKRSPITGYDALIIAKPRKAFSEYEKFLLDQYIMKGGNVIFFIDALSVDITKAEGEGTIAVPFELNLTDKLFRYGLRINRNYVADVNCGTTPVVTGMIGDQPKIELLPWPYFPIISNYSDHL